MRSKLIIGIAILLTATGWAGAVMSPEVAIRVVELLRRSQTPEQSSAALSPQETRC